MFRLLYLISLALSASLPASALCAESNAEPDGVQTSGAIHRIYMPEEGCWNGDLVLYAHGYVAFNEPIAIPEDQLVFSGVSLPAIVNALGYAFAVTSYSANGLAIQEGIADVVDLIDVFNQSHTDASRVYLTGVSEGGVIAALALELFPDKFDAGLSACGPIGDFRAQVNHFGGFRAVFDYFFPNAFPGEADQIPAFVIDNWDTIYEPRFEGLALVSPLKMRQLFAVTKAPGLESLDSRVNTVRELLWYSAFATNDANEKLGGNPFDNRLAWYKGSFNDLRLNTLVDRFAADPDALQAMTSVQTTGVLSKPLVTLHTTGDPVIPYWHESIYRLKTLLAGSGSMHVNIPIERYGHCEFEAAEAVAAFALAVIMSGAGDVPEAEEVLSGQDARSKFHGLLKTAIASRSETASDSLQR